MKKVVLILLALLYATLCFAHPSSKNVGNEMTENMSMETTVIVNPSTLSDTADTLCPALTLPYSEDFENFDSSCWYFTYPTAVTVTSDGVTQYLQINNYYNKHVLPQLNEIIFNIQLSGRIKYGAIMVGVMPADSGTSVIIPFDTIYASSANTWTDFIVSFHNYPGTDGRIVIWGYNAAIDDIVASVIPSCREPYGLQAFVSVPNAATLQWNDFSSNMNYQIEYGLHGFAHGQGTTLRSFSGTTTLTGLHHSYCYDAYVRSICGIDTSEWSLPVTFTALCGDIDTLPFIEDFSMWEVSDYHTTLPHCWTFLPMSTTFPSPTLQRYEDANLQTAHRLSSNGSRYSLLILPRLSYRVQDLRMFLTVHSTGSTSFVVGVSDDTSSYNSFTPVDTINTNHTTSRHETVFSEYTGTGEYIALQFLNGGTIFIDDILLEYIPDCQHPYYATVSNVDTIHATLSWTERGIATRWQIACGPEGFIPGRDTAGVTWHIATTNPYTISGLQPITGYDVYVRGLCPSSPGSPADTSEWWMSPCRFTTIQLPGHIPYRCDFENTTEALQWQHENLFRMCWRYGIVDSLPLSHGYMIALDTTDTTMQHYLAALYRDIDFGTASPGVFDSSLTLSVRIRKSAETVLNYNMLFIITDPTATLANFYSAHMYTGGMVEPDTAWTTVSFDLDTMHGIRRLFFYMESVYWGETEPPLYIDEVDIVPTHCPRAFGLRADNLNDTAVLLSWYGPDNARYLVNWWIPRTTGTAGSPLVSFSDTAITNHLLINDLMIERNYYATVHRICDDGSLTEPSETATFRIALCENESFDTVVNPTPATSTRTTTLPIVRDERYSYSQQIFRAGELGGGGSIHDICFNDSLPGSNALRYVYIYMGHTEAVRFTDYSSFVDPATLQLVYAGPLPSGFGWNRIVLDSPFEYDGVRNLVLAMGNDTGSSKPLSFAANFYNEPLSIVFLGDDEIDYTSRDGLSGYTGSVALSSTRCQVIFGFCSPHPCPAVSLKQPNLRYSRATLRWHGDDSSSYEVYYYNTANAYSATITTRDSFYTINNVYPHYKYIYRVRRVCDGIELPHWTYGLFRTSPDDCPFPEDLHVTNLTLGRASFAWTPDENNTTYTLHIFNGAFDTSVNTIFSHASVSGLPAGLIYYASVQAHCSPDNRTGGWSDTIRFATPVCPASDSLTYSDLQGNSVVLDWQTDSQNGNPEVTQWEIQYGPTGFTQGNGISVFTDHHPYTLQHLIGETNYDAYVRSICSDDYYSEHWSNKITFTTLYSDITEPDTATFTLHPNPTKDHFTIHRLNSDAPFSVIIRDVHGRELVKKQFATLNLEFSTLDYPSGVYFVTIVTPQGTATRKLIIER